MIDYFKICYIAKYPNGTLLDPTKPYREANVLASSKQEAINNLMMEFSGMKIDIIGEPTHQTIEMK